VDSFSGDWEPEKYRDTYRDALCKVIEAKRKGKEVHDAAEPEQDEPTDLMAALRASLESARGGRRRPARAKQRGNGDLEELSKSDLDKLARDAEIEGRSKMTKDELVEALRAA
jgi:DNA end-binding protein Ku